MKAKYELSTAGLDLSLLMDGEEGSEMDATTNAGTQ